MITTKEIRRKGPAPFLVLVVLQVEKNKQGLNKEINKQFLLEWTKEEEMSLGKGKARFLKEHEHESDNKKLQNTRKFAAKQCKSEHPAERLEESEAMEDRLP